MSVSVKDNANIFADEQSFQQAYARARGLFEKIDGVVGVAFGQKQTNGQYKDDIAIVVFVREKKKEQNLAPEERIPARFEGYLTDVRVVRSAGLHGCDNTATYDTIQGGIQISGKMNPTTGIFGQGTLGCIVRKRGDTGRENVYLLTNKHVLFNAWEGADDYAYHPFPPSIDLHRFGPPGDSNSLGPIQARAFYGNVAIPGDSSGTLFFIDCATARIDIDSKCISCTCTKDVIKYSNSIIDLQLPAGTPVNTILAVRSVIADTSIIGQKVFKVGRTTGRTVGKVRLINAPINVPGDPSVQGSTGFQATNLIDIDFDITSVATGVNCKGNPRFSEEGDSGALVLDEQGRAIGLLSMGAQPGDPPATSSDACHIMAVLDNLQICIPTVSGTTHGNCSATDGSGTAAAAVPHAVMGSLGTSGTAAADAPVAPVTLETMTLSPGITEPVPVSDAELRHLQELLATFRNTEKGLELHDAFAHVRREIGYLIRNCRPVKVAWNRNQGPLFLSCALNHLKGRSNHVPLEINGVSRITLLTRMEEMLSKHGSNPLRQAIERYGADFLDILSGGDSVRDWLAHFQTVEFA
jgi:hypothetical protein